MVANDEGQNSHNKGPIIGSLDVEVISICDTWMNDSFIRV